MAAVLCDYPMALEPAISFTMLDDSWFSAELELAVDRDSGRWSWAHSAKDTDDSLSESGETSSSSVQERADRIPTPPPLPQVRHTGGYFVPFPPPPPSLLPSARGRSCSDGAFIPVPPTPPPLPRRARVSSKRPKLSPLRHQPRSVQTAICEICFDRVTEEQLSEPRCCLAKFCTSCVESVVTINISEGRTHIPCPATSCNKPMNRDYILRHLPTYDLKNKYERFRLNDEGGFGKKACPNCCLITERNDIKPFKSKSKKKSRVTPDEYMITCDSCQFEWCFNCQSPWHSGISCENYRQGDNLFKKWTKVRNRKHIPNCQRCPKCNVLIERTEGCNSMTCNQCYSNFCYQCGEKFRTIVVLGDHYSKSSIIGCPYNCYPDRPVRRRLYRGGYLSSKVLAATGYPFLLVGGLAVGAVVLVVGGLVVLPVWGGYKLYKIQRHRRRQRRQR